MFIRPPRPESNDDIERNQMVTCVAVANVFAGDESETDNVKNSCPPSSAILVQYLVTVVKINEKYFVMLSNSFNRI